MIAETKDGLIPLWEVITLKRDKGKSLIALAIVLLFSANSMSACDLKSRLETKPEERIAELRTDDHRDSPSIFVDRSVVRNADGGIAYGYFLDEEGNISDKEGIVVVPHDQATPFSCVTEVTFNTGNTAKTLHSYTAEDGSRVIIPQSFEFELNFNLHDAINRTVTIESSDPGALYIPFDANEDMLKGMAPPERNDLPSITISDVSSPLHLQLVGCYEGEYLLTIRNFKDENIGRIAFSFGIDQKEEQERAYQPVIDGNHEHVFYDEIVEPTEMTRGYTLHICTVCSYTYRDNYTEKLS